MFVTSWDTIMNEKDNVSSQFKLFSWGWDVIVKLRKLFSKFQDKILSSWTNKNKIWIAKILSTRCPLPLCFVTDLPTYPANSAIREYRTVSCPAVRKIIRYYLSLVFPQWCTGRQTEMYSDVSWRNDKDPPFPRKCNFHYHRFTRKNMSNDICQKNWEVVY